MPYTRRTFKETTAPGYFDLSDSASVATQKIVAWFDAVTSDIETLGNRYDEFFRLWMTKDYSSVTPFPEMFLYYLADNYGFSYVRNDLNFIRDLLSYLISPARGENFSASLNQLFDAMVDFGWIIPPWDVIAGPNTFANYAESLVIYSTSVGAPATPSNTPYVERAWSAPIGWTKLPSSATYLSYGHLSGSDIVWSAPRATNLAVVYYSVNLLADLPGAPALGSIGLVNNDGTGDTSSGYYYDGTVWQKFTTSNENQGLVGTDPVNESSAVFAPDGYVSSIEPPPASGPSEGYGVYAILGASASLYTIKIVVELTPLGAQYLDVIITLLKRIKPAVLPILLVYTVSGVTNTVEIRDLNSI